MNKSIQQALIDTTLDDCKNYFNILGICGICRSKIFGEYPKDNICQQCRRDTKLNEILK
jgi:hypothetical protein